MTQQIIIGLTVGIGVAAFSGLVGYLVSHGYNLRNQKAVSDKLNEHTTQISENKAILDEHMANEDAHWTKRERDGLTSQIDRIDANVQRLLERP